MKDSCDDENTRSFFVMPYIHPVIAIIALDNAIRGPTMSKEIRPSEGDNRMDEELRCVLYADPRIDSDRESIEAFTSSRVPGIVIPTGASAGQPELVCGDTTIVGNGPIQAYLGEIGS